MEVLDNREHTQENRVGDVPVQQITDTTEDDKKSSYSMRKRMRTERIKNTQEQLKNMKERQRLSEARKERQPYVQIVCAGIAVTAACYLFYRFYLSAG